MKNRDKPRCKNSANPQSVALKLRVVSPEEGDIYFYTKSITALSKLSFERLSAMCWTCLKLSGNPVFKSLGRFVEIYFLFISNIFFNFNVILLFIYFFFSLPNHLICLDRFSLLAHLVFYITCVSNFQLLLVYAI